jgi:hypothetical protein
MAGPRPPIGPILDLALDSPKDHVRGGEGGNDLRALAPSLLPELTRRGLVDALNPLYTRFRVQYRGGPCPSVSPAHHHSRGWGMAVGAMEMGWPRKIGGTEVTFGWWLGAQTLPRLPSVLSSSPVAPCTVHECPTHPTVCTRFPSFFL